MILDLHRQGLSVTAIARRTGRDPKTVRKYIERGLELPAYGPRQAGRPNKIVPFVDYLRERVSAFPDLSAVRLTREIRERGYDGAYTAVKRSVAAIRPQEQVRPFEVRFETPAGYQAQIDFARFVTEFTDAPGVTRIVWLFSLVWATRATSSPATSCTRTCRRCCAVICRRSTPLEEYRSRSSTTG